MDYLTRGAVSYGREGERLATNCFKKSGYFIAATNYKSAHGEIDIIAENTKFVVFAEVKVRNGKDGYFPKEAVTKSKRRHIIYTAKNYIYRSKTKLIPRFDVIEIITKERGSFENAEVNHIENAFGADNFEFI